MILCDKFWYWLSSLHVLSWPLALLYLTDDGPQLKQTCWAQRWTWPSVQHTQPWGSEGSRALSALLFGQGCVPGSRRLPAFLPELFICTLRSHQSRRRHLWARLQSARPPRAFYFPSCFGQRLFVSTSINIAGDGTSFRFTDSQLGSSVESCESWAIIIYFRISSRLDLRHLKTKERGFCFVLLCFFPTQLWAVAVCCAVNRLFAGGLC